MHNIVEALANMAVDTNDPVDIERQMTQLMRTMRHAGREASNAYETREVVVPEPQAGHVVTLQDMGFSSRAARRALLLTRHDPNAAANYLLAHSGDGDIEAEPTLAELRRVYRARNVQLAAPRVVEPDAAHMEQLQMMGFPEAAVRHALVRTDNDVESAANFLMCLPPDWVPPEPVEAAQAPSDAAPEPGAGASAASAGSQGTPSDGAGAIVGEDDSVRTIAGDSDVPQGTDVDVQDAEAGAEAGAPARWTLLGRARGPRTAAEGNSGAMEADVGPGQLASHQAVPREGEQREGPPEVHSTGMGELLEALMAGSNTHVGADESRGGSTDPGAVGSDGEVAIEVGDAVGDFRVTLVGGRGDEGEAATRDPIDAFTRGLQRFAHRRRVIGFGGVGDGHRGGGEGALPILSTGGEQLNIRDPFSLGEDLGWSGSVSGLMMGDNGLSSFSADDEDDLSDDEDDSDEDDDEDSDDDEEEVAEEDDDDIVFDDRAQDDGSPHGAGISSVHDSFPSSDGGTPTRWDGARSEEERRSGAEERVNGDGE